MNEKVVIIGGGAAGIMFAFELRKRNKECEITVLEKGNDKLYSPCALPYVVAGKFSSISDITVFPDSFYSESKVDLVSECNVLSIDRKGKSVNTNKGNYSYDFLVIATGSSVFVPPIKGLSDVKYFTLKTKQDEISFDDFLKNLSKGSKVAVIGGGLIGLESCHALFERGFKVTVIEAKERILSNAFDQPVTNFISSYLKGLGIEILENCAIDEVKDNVILTSKGEIPYDCILVSTGVRADVSLAKSCGLEVSRGVLVDSHLKTSDPNIFAIGDCAEPFGSLDNERTMSQLGTSALHEGKVVAMNIDAAFSGKQGNFKINNIFNTSVAKLGNLIVGSTGFTSDLAKAKLIDSAAGFFRGKEASEYYPDDREIMVYVVSDKKGRVIGGQIAGFFEVMGRINLLSLAVAKRLSLSDLADGDFAYTPPLNSITDPVAVAAEVCLRRLSDG